MMKKSINEIKSTAHSKYRCQYHIVFAPKFRRKEIYGQLKRDIGEILRKLCEQKGVEILYILDTNKFLKSIENYDKLCYNMIY